jgi:hypothetical protein
MTEMDSPDGIAMVAAKCFADDGNLDLGELNVLLGLALRDNEISDEEKRVVGDIISRLSEANVTPVVWKRVKEIERKYNV